MAETKADLLKERLFLRVTDGEKAQFQAAADAVRKRLSTWARETLRNASTAHGAKTKGGKADGSR